MVETGVEDFGGVEIVSASKYCFYSVVFSTWLFLGLVARQLLMPKRSCFGAQAAELARHFALN